MTRQSKIQNGFPDVIYAGINRNGTRFWVCGDEPAGEIFQEYGKNIPKPSLSYATPEMVEAGVRTLEDGSFGNDLESSVEAIYNTMVYYGYIERPVVLPVGAITQALSALKMAITLRNTFGGLVGGGRCPYQDAINELTKSLSKQENNNE